MRLTSRDVAGRRRGERDGRGRESGEREERRERGFGENGMKRNEEEEEKLICGLLEIDQNGVVLSK